MVEICAKYPKRSEVLARAARKGIFAWVKIIYREKKVLQKRLKKSPKNAQKTPFGGERSGVMCK